jgi:hypothetical protein
MQMIKDMWGMLPPVVQKVVWVVLGVLVVTMIYRLSMGIPLVG